MASIVQICNMALSHIGAGPLISSISPPDGSLEAGYCATFYDMARTELLEPGNWAFSLKRAELATVTNPSSAWVYAYALPSDCLRALRILRPAVAVTVFNQDEVALRQDDRDGAPFDIEGQVLYSDQEEATLLYSVDVTDSARFTPSFAATLSYLLASYLAGPIIKGNEGARVSDAMRSRAMNMADVSLASAANASSAEVFVTSSILAARA
jgi:hypothetical protein